MVLVVMLCSGPLRNKYEATFKACLVLEKLQLDNVEMSKSSVVHDVAQLIIRDPKVPDSVLQTQAVQVALQKGLLVPKPGQQGPLAAMQMQLSGAAALGGLMGQSGLGAGLGLPAANPLLAMMMGNPMGLGMGMPGGAVNPFAVAYNPMAAAQQQQFAMPVLAPNMGGAYASGAKKPVRCYVCQQLGHYANRCPARTASGANGVPIHNGQQGGM